MPAVLGRTRRFAIIVIIASTIGYAAILLTNRYFTSTGLDSTFKLMQLSPSRYNTTLTAGK